MKQPGEKPRLYFWRWYIAETMEDTWRDSIGNLFKYAWTAASINSGQHGKRKKRPYKQPNIYRSFQVTESM